MKRNYLYYLLIVLLLAVSCEKDEMAYTTTVETQEVSSVAATTAQCSGIISSDGNPTIKEAGVEWCTTSDFESNVSCSLADKAKLGKFACDIIDLKDNTQYYVRAYARNSYGTIYGKVLSFKTLEIVLPAVLTDSVTNITISSATIGGEVTDESNGVVTERGVVYSTTPNPTIENSKVVCGSGKGTFSCNLTDLQDGVTYYVRAYAVNEKGTAYGEEKSFKTIEIVVPTVITAAATDITISSATVGGEVTDDGNGVVTERGVVYSTTPNPTIENNKVVCGSGKGTFSCNLTDLQDGVTYYVRAYAVNAKGTAYGEEKSFTTKAITVPTVTTSSVMNISYTSATVGGVVTDDGGATVTERGVVYSTTPNPTTSNSKVVSGSDIERFSCNLKDLQEGTTYYVRAYAVNEKGTAYGEEKSFVTVEVVVPTVTTSSATNISFTSATVGGEILDDGGATVTERGVVYSTTPNPTTSNSKVVSDDDRERFSCNLTDLQGGTTYYVRAYAVNQKGTAYGEEKSFTTRVIPVPIVTTSSVTNISYTSATVGGAVTDDGGATITERGVVYSTTPNPTTSNSKVSSGSGKGAFSCNLKDLQDGTTYYARAYAVNQHGTAYGEEKSFTTKKVINIPTVITSSATNISFTSSTVGGTVTDDGGATVTERGVVYSTTSNPTTSDNKVICGSGKGAFTCNLTDLQEGTIYYVRAYAINEKGTAYGNQIRFTTKSPMENGYEYVDLGLSVKWATCNVGASKPEEYGDYFAWGETQPKSTYNWSTYEYCNGSATTLTKYCTQSYYGTIDNKAILDLSDDAAHADWGGNWRMPTAAERDELLHNCTWIGTTQNGVEGYKVTSNKNGKSIFLPAAGHRDGSSLKDAGSSLYYWSSSLITSEPHFASDLTRFLSVRVAWDGSSRYYGQSVRPVCP